LSHNIKVLSNLEEILKKYQATSKDAFIWGGVCTINKYGHLADQIVLIRTTAIRKERFKFNQAILIILF
jgi:dihydrofolate reductase